MSNPLPLGEPGGCREARERYADQLAGIDCELEALTARDTKLGSIRVGIFFLLVIGFGFAITTGHPFWVFVAVAALVAFLVAVVRNESVRSEMEIRQSQSRTLRRLVRRLDRDWQALAADALGKTAATLQLDARQNALAHDLDLVGDASLFQLVSMAATTPGQRTLANWLTRPVDPEVAVQRHHAVKSLAPARQERLQFYTLAREVGSSTGDPDSFVKWAQSPMWLPSRRWLIPWGNLTAALAVAAIAMLVYATMAENRDLSRISLVVLITIAVVNLSIGSLLLGPVAQIFSIAIQSRRSVEDYAELFRSADLLPTAAPESDQEKHTTESIRGTLLGTAADQESAGHAMTELASIAKAGSLKNSAATFLLYLPLQAFGLWDVRVLKRLEGWKERYRRHAEEWFVALGELESLLSLAALADEYPSWASPDWIQASADSPDTETLLSCEQLGHPLLPDQSRVRNDVSIGPAGTLLLVTGSNMSGKSTMLRSVGLNVALAMAGGPVCCRAMRLPPIEMATSIRVSDDLSQGVSFYMAELKRLAAVVDHARELHGNSKVTGESSAAHPRRLLFLLDEILQGTNSRERQIAVARVLGMLVDSGAIGAITTHDLELADEPELARIAHTVHFRETITPDADGDERMTFDYVMRQGVSPTTNALRLLEMVGLGEEGPKPV
ncbi:MutS family DNA mismatch repair protein [Allorhodopirellula solitaria]|uniref:DNA mismatch repair protein MutS n=1 Tax=Allorhodopirellula solitaria TaxID=2527987 RepID=A0A5C5XVZ7_9BACT|nr:MutS family DNA mismatch repair protein [Allorhodopirellula solitaria]TWT66563.1 DNA mismatch repair protein MutS [Allorhodopirellula solitaria]